MVDVIRSELGIATPIHWRETRVQQVRGGGEVLADYVDPTSLRPVPVGALWQHLVDGELEVWPLVAAEWERL